MAQSGFDRRRVNGPEQTHTPIFDDDVQRADQSSKKVRDPSDIQPIFLRLGLIDQANGSAYIETERTKIACAVYGPRQSRNAVYSEKGKINVEVKFAPFSCHRRRAPMRDAEDRTLAVIMHQALAPSVRLETLPKSTIDIFVTVIEADVMEGCVASGIVAASSALADAGIEMAGLVTSCTASFVDREMWLDPDEDVAKKAKGTLILSCMPALDTVTNIWQSGSLDSEEVFRCIYACQARCADIHAVAAQALRETA